MFYSLLLDQKTRNKICVLDWPSLLTWGFFLQTLLQKLGYIIGERSFYSFTCSDGDSWERIYFLVKAEKETLHYLTAVSILFPANTKTWWDRLFSLNVIVSFEMQWCKHKRWGWGGEEGWAWTEMLKGWKLHWRAELSLTSYYTLSKLFPLSFCYSGPTFLL